MDRITRALKRDWEKALFGAMVLVLLVFLGLWVKGGAPETNSQSKGNATPRKSFLGKDAFAFLDPLQAPRIPDNTFSFGYKAEDKHPWRRPHAKTNTTATTPRKPATAPTASNAKPPVQKPTPKPPAKPAAPPPARVLTYRGYLESTSGQQVAFVTVLDPNSKKSRMERLAVGRDIDGIKIKDFSGDQLDVVAPNGKPLRIPKGGRRKIVLE